DLVQAPAGAIADEVELGDLARRGRGVALRERRVGREQEDVRVAEQLLRLEGPLRERHVRERQVELAALDEREQLGVVRLLFEPDLDSWPRGAEPAHQLGEDARADRLVDADAEDA